MFKDLLSENSFSLKQHTFFFFFYKYYRNTFLSKIKFQLEDFQSFQISSSLQFYSDKTYPNHKSNKNFMYKIKER